jgi:hypothetical protein
MGKACEVFYIAHGRRALSGGVSFRDQKNGKTRELVVKSCHVVWETRCQAPVNDGQSVSGHL